MTCDSKKHWLICTCKSEYEEGNNTKLLSYKQLYLDESRAINLIYCEKKGKSAKLWDDFFSCRCYLHPSDRSNVVSVNQFCNFTSITIHYSQWLRQYTPEYEMRSLIIMYKIMWDENLGQISLIIQINAIFYLCYFITNDFLALDMYLYSY